MQSTHTDFASNPYNQYAAYPASMPSVANNPGHDMSKSVAAVQPNMFPNTGNVPTGAQHHQQQMGGQVPSPQSAVLQQGQQMTRASQLQMSVNQRAYFSRTPVPGSIPNMTRNINTVVNPQGHQPNSQFSQVVTVPYNMQMMINQIQPVYQQRFSAPPPQPYIINTHGPQHMNAAWYYPQATPQNSNGYYAAAHGMQASYSMPQQPIQQQPMQPAPQSQKRTKALPILDPNTGKSIFDNDDSSSLPTPEKENENADPVICAQFATQVAATIKDKGERPSKPPLEESRSVDSTNAICPDEEIYSTDVVKDSGYSNRDIQMDITNNENICDLDHVPYHERSPVPTYRREDTSSNSINECSYDPSKVVMESNETETFEEIKSSEVEPCYTEHETILKSENVQRSEQVTVSKQASFSEVVESVTQDLETCNIEMSSNVETVNVEEENQIPDVCAEPSEFIPPVAISKVADKAVNDAKKNKAKKKKDYNKRGESKEGGEMDAYIDNKDGPSISPVQTPASIEDCEPVTIRDSDILKNIPLPGEPVDVTIRDSDILKNIPLQVEPASNVTIRDSDTTKTIPIVNEPIETLPQTDSLPVEIISDTTISPTVESEEKENISDESNKKPLKYSYKEDQWSPLNPEGKKQYDRDFLLQLQQQPMSLCKPTNLPNLDVIKDKAHIQKLSEFNRVIPQIIPQIRPYNDFMPNYARGGGPRMPHPAMPRRSQGRGGEKPKKIISFSSSLNQQVKLHESENAWKPGYKAEPPAELPETLVEKDKLKKNVQGILNKLTPQKFDALLNQLKGLNIDTEEKLTLVIDLIFEKAIDEPNFSVSYANLCKSLALTRVPLGDQSGQYVNFRKLLLTKCQKEFEKDRNDELNCEERMKAIEAADPAKKKEMKLEYDEEAKKIRYRQLGNIRFIGELFKLSMLIEPIMHECIKKLLCQGDEESLECLCRLLKTIGKELDEGKQSKDRREMDLYFQQMQQVVNKRLTSSRVRFMLQDIIDLKRGNWVPRRDENNPKTIDQIHQEMEREAREQQQVLQNMSTSNYPKRMADDRDRRKGGRMGQTEDGWTPSSSKSNKGSYSVVDPTKLKLTKPDEVDSMRLGPGGRGMHSWGRGSSGGNKSAADGDKTALANRYSALSEQPLTSNYEGRRGSQRSAASSRESSRGRSNQLPPMRKTPSTSERDNLIETLKEMSRAGEQPPRAPAPQESAKKGAADVHLNGKDADELTLRGPEYLIDDIEKKTKPLIDEFLHNNDFEEAIKCVTELASPNTVHMFITSSINQVLERSSQARFSLGQLLYSLLKKKIITFEQYKKGFSSVLEIMDDYALDIPLIWDYMGELLEPMVEDSDFPLTRTREVLQPCIPSDTAGMLMSAMLHAAAKRKGTIKLGEVWKESGLQWTDFLGPDANVNEFIQKHKLEFTVSPTKVKPSTQMPLDEIKKNLLVLLKKSENSEEIFDWIDANVSENTEPYFIRALVTAVHETAIKTDSNGRQELDVTSLKSRLPLLTRYIDHNDKLELQALYAIQRLTNDLGQPSGLLHQIFDVLYDDDVISEESFKEWELSDDPNEAEGKGVAVHSLKSFFTWLREPDED